jgi:DNA-binding MarR family transcriptional regulator
MDSIAMESALPDEPKPTEGGASDLLMHVSGFVYRMLRHEARRQRVPWTALMVLKDLELLGPSSQRRLAEIEHVRAPTMTVVIQQMEKQGWIRRDIDRGDARVCMVSITRKGQQQLRTAGRLLRLRLDQELSHIPDGVLNRLKDGLSPLAAVLTPNLAPGGRRH